MDQLFIYLFLVCELLSDEFMSRPDFMLFKKKKKTISN